MVSFATTSGEKAQAPARATETSRSWAYAGVFAALLGIGVTWCIQFVLGSAALDAGSTAILPKLHTDGNEALWRVSSGLGYVCAALLIFFAVGARRLLDARSNGRSMAPSVIFGSLLVTAAILAISMSFRAQVFDGIDGYAADPSSHVTINRLSQDTVLTAWATLLAGSAAVAWTGVRAGGIFPRWLGWFSAIMSLLIAALCMVGLAFPANVPALLWLLVFAGWAIREAS